MNEKDEGGGIVGSIVVVVGIAIGVVGAAITIGITIVHVVVVDVQTKL